MIRYSTVRVDLKPLVSSTAINKDTLIELVNLEKASWQARAAKLTARFRSKKRM